MGNGNGAVEIAPDGYAVCPACGHHTSAYCGRCTVISPVTFRYCGCNCYEAVHGHSVIDVIAGTALFGGNEHRRRILAARSDDPSAQAPGETDWRDQEVADVEELTGEADGAD